jgi:hypothetical protein
MLPVQLADRMSIGARITRRRRSETMLSEPSTLPTAASREAFISLYSQLAVSIPTMTNTQLVAQDFSKPTRPTLLDHSTRKLRHTSRRSVAHQESSAGANYGTGHEDIPQCPDSPTPNAR